MKIQFCSDLHLEFYQNRKWINDNPLIPIGDILIIAGDIDYLGKEFGNKDFFKRISEDFKEIYIIPGNHEYYGGFDASTALKKTNEKLFKNVTLINNDVVEINDFKLIFSTMWSAIENYRNEILERITDFKKIKFHGKTINIEQFNSLHKKSFEFIKTKTKGVQKKIVITHHLPSKFCNSEEFKYSIYNEAFCIDQTDFIKQSNINFWIYGHSHRNLNEIDLNGTKLVTNQMGYVAFNEHLTFQRDKFVII